MPTPRHRRFAVLAACGLAILAAPRPADAQRCGGGPGSVSHGPPGLSSSQIDELDLEGALLTGFRLAKPPLDDPSVLDRVAGSQRAFLERNSRSYLVLPNGDALNAYRGLRLRELEDEMRFARGSALDRLEREFHELAPGGEHLFGHADGTVEYLDRPPAAAQEGETVYEFVGLPPMHEAPVRPHADTLGAHAIFGSRLEAHRGNDFHIDQQTDRWLIGHAVREGVCSPQRIAVLREGARITGNRLERACVLWPLNRTAEGRRDYWDRAPLPLFVALNAEDFLASPAELASAAERGRVVLRTYAASSDRTRAVTVDKESSRGTGFVRKARRYGPWQHRVIWRATPVQLRIIDAETHARRAEPIERQHAAVDAEREDQPANGAVTHTLTLRDARVMRGRLISDAHAAHIEFVVVVGSLEQTMTFGRREVEGVEPAE